MRTHIYMHMCALKYVSTSGFAHARTVTICMDKRNMPTTRRAAREKREHKMCVDVYC